MTLCLDISGKCTGHSLFDDKGVLLHYGRITPDPKLDPYRRMTYVVNEVKKLLVSADTLVIEGIFLGRFKGCSAVTVFEYLAKIAGAIIYVWLIENDNLPIIYKAVQARKLVGIKGTCQKAEVQIFILEKYKMCDQDKIDDWQLIIDGLYVEKLAKEITQGQFKYRADKLSKIIDKETGLGEDTADSILLGLAYNEDTKNQA